LTWIFIFWTSSAVRHIWETQSPYLKPVILVTLKNPLYNITCRSEM
jgi:hypothetical protein